MGAGQGEGPGKVRVTTATIRDTKATPMTGPSHSKIERMEDGLAAVVALKAALSMLVLVVGAPVVVVVGAARNPALVVTQPGHFAFTKLSLSVLVPSPS